jgi:hypothetical protein
LTKNLKINMKNFTELFALLAATGAATKQYA